MWWKWRLSLILKLKRNFNEMSLKSNWWLWGKTQFKKTQRGRSKSAVQLKTQAYATMAATSWVIFKMALWDKRYFEVQNVTKKQRSPFYNTNSGQIIIQTFAAHIAMQHFAILGIELSWFSKYFVLKMFEFLNE